MNFLQVRGRLGQMDESASCLHGGRSGTVRFPMSLGFVWNSLVRAAFRTLFDTERSSDRFLTLFLCSAASAHRAPPPCWVTDGRVTAPLVRLARYFAPEPARGGRLCRTFSAHPRSPVGLRAMLEEVVMQRSGGGHHPYRYGHCWCSTDHGSWCVGVGLLSGFGIRVLRARRSRAV